MGECARERTEAVKELLVETNTGARALGPLQAMASLAKANSPETPQPSAVAPADPLALLAALIAPRTGQAPSMALAADLLARVNAPDVDFRLVSPMMALLIARLPPEAWDALQQHAVQSSGGGIRNVLLPDTIPGASPGLMDGINRLPELRSVSLACKGRSQIDLRGFRQASGRMPDVEVRCLEDWPLVVSAPPGMQVHASANFVSLNKWWVHYKEPGSELVLEARTLAGQNYHHQHLGIDGRATPARQAAQMDIRLNCEAQFPLASDAALMNDRRIACRHLALQWLHDRAEHLESKVEVGTARFPYGPYESREGIIDHVPARMDVEYHRLMKAGAQSLCEAGQFGNWVSSELGRLRDGQTVRFAIETHNHMMSVELRHKGSEYILNFYEPNATATHQRMVVHDPRQLQGKSLENWIGNEGVQGLAPGAGGPGLFAVYGWQADAETAATPGKLDDSFVSAAGKASPEYLAWCLSEGQADSAIAAMRLAPDPLQHGPAERAAFVHHMQGGLHRAMQHGHTAAMQACVAFVLGAKDEVLTVAQKLAIFRPGFAAALLMAEGEVAALFARMVASAADKALPMSELYGLFAARMATSGYADDDIPVLQIIAAAQVVYIADPAIVRRQHHAVFAFLRALVSATNLPLNMKTLVCGPMYGYPITRTAAWNAMSSGNPGMAGAIACAMLEGAPDSATALALLDSLHVSLHDVLTALGQTGHWEDAEWAQRILDLLDRSGLPKDEIDALLHTFSAKIR